jgi:glycosyltransferase involved in cell wall biosynthesis
MMRGAAKAVSPAQFRQESFNSSPAKRQRPTGSGSVTLSILMPAYNEAETIEAAVNGVLGAQYPCPVEVIVVDDGSIDGTRTLLAGIDDERLTVLGHERNLGKGAALKTAAAAATGTHIVPFDADLEYSPQDLATMLAPIIAGRCEVVYGTRLFGVNTVYQSFRYAIGNRAMTFAANVLFDANLSDLHTCLKLVPRALFEQLRLTESGFGLDTEITAALLRRGIRPFEVPVSYFSRSHDQGKKITWRDGVACLAILAKMRLDAQLPTPRPHRAITNPRPARDGAAISPQLSPEIG